MSWHDDMAGSQWQTECISRLNRDEHVTRLDQAVWGLEMGV